MASNQDAVEYQVLNVGLIVPRFVPDAVEYQVLDVIQPPSMVFLSDGGVWMQLERTSEAETRAENTLFDANNYTVQMVDQAKLVAASTAQFSSVTDPCNTEAKYAGRPGWNTTVHRSIWATRPGALDHWVYADGTTAATPSR